MDERVGLLIDAYNEVFLKYPTLPLFLIRELHRNVDFMIETMERAGFMDVLWQIRDVIQALIDSGHVEKVPIRFLLFNFYSLLCVPYLSKNLSKKLLDEDEDGFRKMLTEWKPVIISQMHSFALGQGKTA
jgi:steroid 5-alpha reductase family enzyme